MRKLTSLEVLIWIVTWVTMHEVVADVGDGVAADVVVGDKAATMIWIVTLVTMHEVVADVAVAADVVVGEGAAKMTWFMMLVVMHDAIGSVKTATAWLLQGGGEEGSASRSRLQCV